MDQDTALALKIIREKISNNSLTLSGLNTLDQTSLVNAINEVKAGAPSNSGPTSVAGPIIIGTPPNYAQFDATGHLTFFGTAQPWDDLRHEPTSRSTGSNVPVFEKWIDDAAGTSRGLYLYSFDDAVLALEKELFFEIQMPHAWNGGVIQTHVHWIGNLADTTAAPRWGLEYSIADIGEVFPDSTIIYTTGTNIIPGSTDPNVTPYRHYISAFPGITPPTTANDISAVLLCRVFRNSSSALDTYDVANNKCGLLYIDTHYQIARIGSNEEYTP